MGAGAQANANISAGMSLPAIPPSGTRTCPVGRIRYAIFFDGTNNNAFRDWNPNFAEFKGGDSRAGTLTQRAPNPKKKDDPLDPPNAPTNVAKLYTLFKEKPNLEERLYIIGVGAGSATDTPDDGGAKETAQQATGYGARAKIDKGIEQLTNFVNRGPNPLSVEKRVDVFGFSRGSAEARDFLNKVKASGIEDKSQGKTDYRYVPAGRTVVRVPTYPRMTGILFEFCGVFDTVASMGAGALWSAGNVGYDFFVNGRPADKKKKPDEILNTPCEKEFVHDKEGWVHRTFHCIADDEHRDLFPLEVLGRDPKGWWFRLLPRNMREQSYPGAHSDVGGGYRSTPGKAAVPPRKVTTYTEFGMPYEMEVGGSDAVLPKWGNLSHIPLADMHKEAMEGHVPLDPLSSLPADLWQIDAPGAPPGVPSLSSLYGSYIALRTRLINQFVKRHSKWADYTKDIPHDPVYLQALPEGIYQNICTERDKDANYLSLYAYYIHLPSEATSWRIMDGIRRVVRILTFGSSRDLNLISGQRQRDVHFMGLENSYDDDCYL